MTQSEASKRYNQSPKGKARQRRYSQSPKGIMARYRFEETEHRRKYKREYNQRWYAEHPDYHRERYHRIQDEAGCHADPGTFYPGYRFIKALETAEVVEWEP